MMEEIGLTYDVMKELNPKVAYIAISGFCRSKKYEGPFNKDWQYDIVAQAMGGLMHLAGEVRNLKERLPGYRMSFLD